MTPQYGGNISQVVWKVKGREKQAYTLKYDSENRMTEAIYSDIANSGSITGNRYDEKLTYDIRGNIQTLQRWGLNGSCTWGLIDNLTYNYGASDHNPKNQLQTVTDYSDLTKGFKTAANGSTYSYDNNGNMTADPNKAITNIAYNHLNLPTTITFTNNRTINFLYDAGGNKLRKTVVQSGTTQYTQDYVGGIEYRNGILEAIYHAEGRITTISGTLMYEYAMKDHLGNTRLMFCDKNNNGVITQSGAPESSEVTQENHYYAFGMAMENVWYNTPSVVDNKYMYNGKELNDDFGLGLSDYGARMYDPATLRWSTFDPMAEAYQSMSPYHYGMNNPMRFIDPNGMYSNDGTTSRNTSALATDGSMVGGALHVESNGQSEKTGDGDKTKVSVALVTPDHGLDGIEEAMRAAGIKVLTVLDSQNALDQLLTYIDPKFEIEHLFIVSHGTYNESSFDIGNIQYDNKNGNIKNDPNLEKIGSLVKGDIILLACFAGRFKDGGKELMQSLAKATGKLIWANEGVTIVGKSSFSSSNPYIQDINTNSAMSQTDRNHYNSVMPAKYGVWHFTKVINGTPMTYSVEKVYFTERGIAFKIPQEIKKEE